MTNSPTSPAPFDVIHDGMDVPENLRGGIVAIGNFDGVHRGHRAVISEAISIAKRQNRPTLALTFEPHPRSYFRPDVATFRLTDERNKLRLMAATGLNGAVVMTFDAKRAATNAEDFINQDLRKRLALAGLVVGFDFQFGKNRTGTPAMLKENCEAHGVAVHIVPDFNWKGLSVSSSDIRTALQEGRLDTANMLLGYPFFVSGEVIHGEKRGRGLGYPTANIRLDPACDLKHGIYAVRVGRGTERYDAVASFGRRPTFDNGAPLLEIYLFDFKGDLYGQTLDAAFIAHLRDEMKFDSLDALIAQMDQDSVAARKALAADKGFPILGTLRGE